MPKRRITKASKRRLTIFGTISVIAIIYFCFSLIRSGYLIYTLSIEKKNLNELFVELKKESENLKLDIEKLNDPKYLADYARENYLYSKDGEYILQIDEIIETKTEIDTISNDINKNYALLGLSLILLLMFIYIFIKSKRNNTKK